MQDHLQEIREEADTAEEDMAREAEEEGAEAEARAEAEAETGEIQEAAQEITATQILQEISGQARDTGSREDIKDNFFSVKVYELPFMKIFLDFRDIGNY